MAYALNKIGIEKMKVIDEEMIKIMDNISSIQQKRVHAEREQSRKNHKLSVELVLVQNKSIFYD